MAGIWLTVLMRGVQLKSLTRYNRDTTARFFCICCYRFKLSDNYYMYKPTYNTFNNANLTQR